MEGVQLLDPCCCQRSTVLECDDLGDNVHTLNCWTSSSTQESSQSMCCILRFAESLIPRGTWPSLHEQHVVGTGVPVDQQFDAPSDFLYPVVNAVLSPVLSLLPFCTGGYKRVVLDALPSPVQSQLLTCAAGSQRVVLDALPSPVQSQLLTCAAGCQRVVLDAALSPVPSRLPTCAAGIVDAPVSVVPSRLPTCAAGVVDAPVSLVPSRLPTCAAGCQRVVLDGPVSPVQTAPRAWLYPSVCV